VRDDDEKTFEIIATASVANLVDRVSASLALGRRIRCIALPDHQARERERRFLVARGYRPAPVKL
jgi:hypothetical protein